jgi:hypothetical protein
MGCAVECKKWPKIIALGGVVLAQQRACDSPAPIDVDGGAPTSGEGDVILAFENPLGATHVGRVPTPLLPIWQGWGMRGLPVAYAYEVSGGLCM